MKLQLQRHLGERSPSLDAGFNQNTTNYVCSPYGRNCKLCSRVSATRGVVGSYPIARMAASEQEGWLTWLRTEDGEDDARGLVIGTADAEEASCPVGGFEIKREREKSSMVFKFNHANSVCGGKVTGWKVARGLVWTLISRRFFSSSFEIISISRIYYYYIYFIYKGKMSKIRNRESLILRMMIW